MEFENKYASRGVAGTALGLGAGAIGLEVLRGGLGGLFGNGCTNGCAYSRYDAEKDARIAALEADKKLLESNIYGDQKSLELYRYIDGKLSAIDAAIAAQNVRNQAVQDSFQLAEERRACGEKELHAAIMRECEARKCADNTLVNYMNATFYPKQVADVTVGTTSTPQTLYNPLPVSNCGSGCGC